MIQSSVEDTLYLMHIKNGKVNGLDIEPMVKKGKYYKTKIRNIDVLENHISVIIIFGQSLPQENRKMEYNDKAQVDFFT